MKVTKTDTDIIINRVDKNDIVVNTIPQLFMALDELGINPNESEIGIMQMIQANHRVIYFGDINGTFMFTEK